MENINFEVTIMKRDDPAERKVMNLEGCDFLLSLGEDLNEEKNKNELSERLLVRAIDKLKKMYKEEDGKEIFNIWYYRYQRGEIFYEVESGIFDIFYGLDLMEIITKEEVKYFKLSKKGLEKYQELISNRYSI